MLGVICFALISIYCKAEQPNEEQDDLNNYEPYISVYYHADNNALSLIHVNSIQKIDDSTVNFWTIQVNKNKKLKEDTFKFLNQVDCKLNKIRYLQAISSVKNKILLYYTFENPTWEYIAPHAINETFKSMACSLAFNQNISEDISKRIILLPKDQIKLVETVQKVLHNINNY